MADQGTSQWRGPIEVGFSRVNPTGTAPNSGAEASVVLTLDGPVKSLLINTVVRVVAFQTSSALTSVPAAAQSTRKSLKYTILQGAPLVALSLFPTALRRPTIVVSKFFSYGVTVSDSKEQYTLIRLTN